MTRFRMVAVTLASAAVVSACGSHFEDRAPGSWVTPPGHACVERYRMIDQPAGNSCQVVPDRGAKPELHKMTIRGPRGPREITYEVVDGVKITEGDIIIGTDDPRAASHTRGAGRYEVAGAVTDGWPSCTIPYTIDSTLPNTTRVKDAMAHWAAKTCVNFVERTTENDYVTFRPGSGCSATVGRAGGHQYINLANGCSTGNTIHEIGHAVGLWHEQSRVDRESYIVINSENIQPGYEHNFGTYSVGADLGTFDFGSIMLYGSYAFSSNGSPTITKLDGSTFVGQRTALSATDVTSVSDMYTALPDVCPPEGC